MSSSESDLRDTKIFNDIVGFFGPGTATPRTYSSAKKSKSFRSVLINFANYTTFDLAISEVEGPFGQHAPNTSELLDYCGKGGYVQWLAEIDYDGDINISMNFALRATKHSPLVDESTLPFSLNALVEGRDAQATLAWLDGNEFDQIVGGKELRLRKTIYEPGSDERTILNVKIEQVGYGGN